jgi:5-formyltetrahydrofolate cyclo-ligase
MTSTAPESKKSMRPRVLAARRALSAAERTLASARIQAALLARPEWAHADVIALYRPMSTEVDTAALAAAALAAGKRVAYPVVSGSTLRFVAPAPGAGWTRDPLGMEVPSDGAEVPMEAIRLWVVPGVAFDADGARMGMGMGFYDRVLPQRQGLAVGLAFAVQLVPQVPTEPHDARLDAVVTEQGPARGRLWTGFPG